MKSEVDEMFQVREFKANPMRDLTPVLPPKRPQPLTKPVPFELEVDVRGAVKAEEFKKQVIAVVIGGLTVVGMHWIAFFGIQPELNGAR